MTDLDLNPITGKLDLVTPIPPFAPPDASYVTLSTNATLSNERVLTGTANQVTVTDNGAGSTVVLSTPQDIHTAATPTFSNLTLSARTSTRVPYFTTGGAFTDSSTFVYNGTQLQLSTTGSTGGVLVGGDAQWFRGAANRMDLATGDSLYVVGGGGTLSVGIAPNSLYSAYIDRQEASLVASTSQSLRAGLTVSAGVNSTSFPTACRFDATASSGVTNVDYIGGALCNVVVSASQTGGTVANSTGGEFNVRVNSTGTTITLANGGLFKAGFFNTAATGTITTCIGGLFAGSHVDSSGACTTNRAAQFETRAPLGGITTNTSVDIRTPSASATRVITTNYGIFINTQRVSPGITNSYGIYFGGTSRTIADGIAFDNNSIQLYPIAANILGLGNGDSFQFDAGNIITDTTTGTKIGTATTQKLGFWNATPIVQPTTAVAAATFVANTSGIVDDTATFDGYTIGQVVKALRNAGLLA